MKKHTWHIFISGFQQDESTMHGVQSLWLKMRRKLVGPNTFVCLRSWDNEWDKLAQKILLASGTTATVTICGYSWGGASSVLFARELQARGIAVDEMVLCDPVYRSKVKYLGWFRSMMNYVAAPKITIPANVRRVRWMRQKIDKPMGHDLVAEDTALTVIDDAVICQVDHHLMDEQPWFARLVNQAFGG